MSQKSPFLIHKALIGIGGEPKSIQTLRSGDLLIETISALQSKSFLLAKTFIDSPLTVTPHRTLNSCRGVISESDLLCASETEILEGLSDQGVTQCQRFGHSQTSCRGQLTCSRCASVEHSSTDCTLEPKCVNCTQSRPSDSKICPKWKLEKQIQEIKVNKNISYPEAPELLPSTSSTEVTVSEPQPPIPVSSDAHSTTYNMITPVGSSSVMSASSFVSGIQHPSESSTIPDLKQNAKTRARKRKKELLKK
ncbi:uncharacterized protein TNCV_3233821 [Trichonephila clavipes]|nr:uncharacterized protein TNCV_3233821 [Trichonephila clavipes]